MTRSYVDDLAVLRDLMGRIRRRTDSVERRMALTHLEHALSWLSADAAVIEAQGHDSDRGAPEFV